MGLSSKQDQHQPEPLKCPRCDSSNTKFCYYNNYNRSQPRHFCKACKRHWTKGGTLRNVPVGGGRKNKRLKTSNRAGGTTKTSSTAMGIQWQAQQQPLPPTSLLDSSPLCLPRTRGFEFLFSSSSPFDTISTSFQSPSIYNYIAEPMKDPNGTVPQTWQVPITSTGMMNMANFWNLDDIDALVSSDINVPWDDDYEIKP
ncbi:hypothetical protein HRI_001429700 [Hibiscus trionum]|uniref:Dof zinc finger protein n=1 Tax=Hibiscus trionum TaxID=183268 RepID=A0A9W7HHM5_HIBTR|nr:hypothetical protein HRI_001429700 [Hibiscus trionum]